jgi:hypothetical protein
MRKIMARWIWNRCLCLSAILLTAAALASAADLHVKFIEGFPRGEFRLEGWSGGSQPPAAGWESVFAVYAGGSRTPMLGTYSVEGNALVFRPRFPIEPGIGYHGTFPGGGFVCDPAPKPAPSTRVEHVYPSTDVLPANTLKLYICFSSPMSVGEAFQHVQLLDDSGKAVPDAFLDEELWDPDHKRLTILFDPGRIKRGLVPAKEMGTAIVEGKHYTLVIDSGWHDARGVRLKDGFEKVFLGGPADRTPPDPKHWRITAPSAGTMQPLIVDFPEPMDFALLRRMLNVAGIRGTAATENDETEWRFTPDAPWSAGSYVLNADTALEDISGNRLDRPFDVDLHEKPKQHGEGNTISIPFTVQP